MKRAANGPSLKIWVSRMASSVSGKTALKKGSLSFVGKHVSPMKFPEILRWCSTSGRTYCSARWSSLSKWKVTVSSFLPLVEERSGAKFLVQADFLVQPGREAIQYELSWNRWLVGEAVEAAKTAIERFKRDPRWGPQFLPLFKFTSYPGQLAYEKLFGPCLKNPVLEYLRSSEVMPTAAGVYVRPDLAVRPEAGLEQLLDDAALPLLFSGRTDLSLIDSTVDMEALPDELRQCIREIGFGEVARNKKVLERRLNHPEWLTRFYEAMS